MLDDTIKIKDLKNQMGLYVKSLRKQDKLTQGNLAELLDLSRMTIQNLESGNNFTIDTLLKVLQHFDMLHQLNQWVLDAKSENENLPKLY